MDQLPKILLGHAIGNTVTMVTIVLHVRLAIITIHYIRAI